MLLRIFLVFAVSPLIASLTLRAQSADGPELSYPILDAPFNLGEQHAWPSMEQSLTLSKDFYQLSHYGIEKVIDPYADGWPGFWGRLAFFTFDGLISVRLPLGNAWLHEEWHRAVMSNREVSSHNGVYDHFGSLIPVNHVTDEDLIRLKKDFPADQIRLAEAGMEGEHQLGLRIEMDHYFYGAKTFDDATLWFTRFGPFFYLNECAYSHSTKATAEQNEHDGSDVAERDFTGLDCLGWVYDLHRADEPYEARGVHPSGVGINRYRTLDDLTDEEKNYLVLQRNLSLLNFVDPFLFSESALRSRGNKGEKDWLVRLRHDLASFGYLVGGQVFAQNRGHGLLLDVNAYVNHERTFPGIDARWLGREMMMPHCPVVPSLRLAAWQQPKNQSFFASEAIPGGLVGLKMALASDRWLTPFVELEGKTQGWVAGNVYLDRNFSTRIGVSSRAF